MVRAFNFLDRLRWIPFAFLGLVLVVGCLMLADNSPPGELVRGSERVTLTEDRLIVSYEFERIRFCNASVTRSIIDPQGRMEHMTPMSYTADQVRELQSIGHNRVVLIMPRPAVILPGRYLFQANVEYACNRAQELWPIRVAISIPFELMP